MSGQKALDICSGIQCYTYNREDLNQRRLGCIADEVKAVMASELPEVQNVTGSTMHKPGDLPYQEYLTMDYGRLVAPLCAAVGQLRKEIDELRQKLQELEKLRTK